MAIGQKALSEELRLFRLKARLCQSQILACTQQLLWYGLCIDSLFSRCQSLVAFSSAQWQAPEQLSMSSDNIDSKRVRQVLTWLQLRAHRCEALPQEDTLCANPTRLFAFQPVHF